MKKQYSISSFSVFILFLHCINTFAQSPAAAPAQAPPAVVAQPPASTPTQAAAPNGITNVTRILEKAGHFTIFIRLLRSTQEENHLFSALNDSSSGLTIFAPTDSAFSELKSGTLNTLSDGDKSELVKFHVVPTFLSTSQFQTVSNPLGTWAGTGSRLPLNVTSYPNSVNITTGLTNTSLSGTVYTDNQLAIYKIEKVLLPKDVFGSKAPAPAPAAPAREKPTKAVPEATVESPVSAVDISGALMFTHNNVVGSVKVVGFVNQLLGKSTYWRISKWDFVSENFGGDEGCPAEKSYSGGCSFACKVLTSFFVDINLPKVLRVRSSGDGSSDGDHRGMSNKWGVYGANYHEIRGEKACRKADLF
ncbi:hypothetical protein OIU76_015873 [Salix suchowensis]|nr:hypothetical protein OIU76_015873 [Salix suchowensis]